MSYKIGDVPRTNNIDSIGYFNGTISSVAGMDVFQYNIIDLIPYTNYTVHIQAIITPMGRDVIGGMIVEELLKRTQEAGKIVI